VTLMANVALRRLGLNRPTITPLGLTRSCFRCQQCGRSGSFIEETLASLVKIERIASG
jgi:ribosomal protein S14